MGLASQMRRDSLGSPKGHPVGTVADLSTPMGTIGSKPPSQICPGWADRNLQATRLILVASQEKRSPYSSVCPQGQGSLAATVEEVPLRSARMYGCEVGAQKKGLQPWVVSTC